MANVRIADDPDTIGKHYAVDHDLSGNGPKTLERAAGVGSGLRAVIR